MEGRKRSGLARVAEVAKVDATYFLRRTRGGEAELSAHMAWVGGVLRSMGRARGGRRGKRAPEPRPDAQDAEWDRLVRGNSDTRLMHC